MSKLCVLFKAKTYNSQIQKLGFSLSQSRAVDLFDILCFKVTHSGIGILKALTAHHQFSMQIGSFG